MKIQWPEGKTFAFTIFDDTDLSRPGNFEEVYALLDHCGMRTTKSVWPLQGEGDPTIGGATCKDPKYLETIHSLQRRGFEVGFHNTTFHGVQRNRIKEGLDSFRQLFGDYPVSMSNHADSSEAIYWGDARVSGFNRRIYNLLTRNRNKNSFFGHIKGSEYYWGDLCHEHIRYVRNFITPDINTLKYCPWMPYHDPERPYVRYWFASSEGPKVNSFNDCITEQNQDRLEEEGGACIMYTHFACGFQDDSHRTALNPRFKLLIQRLARKKGWYVPVSTLLDYILKQQGSHVLTPSERSQLERKWLCHKIWLGSTS